MPITTSLSSGLPALGVRVDDESRQVVAVFEQEDIMETLTMFHKWFNDGIINADAAVLAEVPSYRPFYVAQGWPYAAVSTWGPSMGVNAIAVQLGDTILSNVTVQGSLNSISINCAHPDKALEFLNLINTDSYVRDLFAYGEDGVDWEYNEQGLITRHNPAWDIPAYTQGTFFNLTQETEYNQYEEEVRPLNDNAVPSVMLGFFFDTTNVQDQLASCIEIYNRYKNEVLTGTTDPATSVPQMMEEMRAAASTRSLPKRRPRSTRGWSSPLRNRRLRNPRPRPRLRPKNPRLSPKRPRSPRLSPKRPRSPRLNNKS